jgi:hypothetical protein
VTLRGLNPKAAFNRLIEPGIDPEVARTAFPRPS